MAKSVQISEIIREIIIQQETLVLNGGTVHTELRWLRVLKTRLFHQVGIIYTEEVFNMLFDFPFNQMLDIEDPCTPASCSKLTIKLRNKYMNHTMLGLTPVWGKDAKRIDLEYKVRCVMKNLSFFTGEIYD